MIATPHDCCQPPTCSVLTACLALPAWLNSKTAADFTKVRFFIK